MVIEMNKNNPNPPYFGIAPDRAEVELGDPLGSADFAELAQRFANGRTVLAARGMDTEGKKHLRLFSTWEITRYMIPVAQAHFRRVLKANPDLPQGSAQVEKGSKWFTLEEVLTLRQYFAQEGAKHKDYVPYRPKGLPARIAAIANFKGGVSKSVTTAHLAMSAALDGYRILVIDLDSQGSISSIFGTKVADEWQTIFPLLARHYAKHLMAENQARLSRGEAPQPLDDTLDEARKLTASNLIQSTHWHNIDIIGAQLNLYWAEFQIPVWRMGARSWKLWDALTDSLAQDGVLDDYDIVLLDTPPALGYLTINGLTAADILLVPTGASFLEFDSTGRFFDMLHATFQSIEEGENIVARALGREGLRFEWDAVRTLITRYDNSQQAEFAALMQGLLGSVLASERQEFTALIGQASEQVAGIYEADYRDFNRETYIRGRETFDATYAMFKRLVVGSWRRAEKG
ncbi:AAA family ATPase [Roseibaca sp. Y0-43]|nr:AAA family ATPase [Roseibaca sp. Y0-43]